MSAPPPGVSPARLRRRHRIFTGLLLFLAGLNIGAAIWVITRTGFADAIASMLLAVMCLFYAAKRMWTTHSRLDRRA